MSSYNRNINKTIEEDLASITCGKKKMTPNWCDVCGAGEDDGAVIQYYDGQYLCKDCKEQR